MDEIKRLLVAKTITPVSFDPGFITLSLSHHGYEIFNRQCSFPEDFFIELERRFSKDAESRKKLYAAGKNFGYDLAERMYSYPDKSEENRKKFVSYLVDLYLNGRLGKIINDGFQSQIHLFWLTEKDAIICRSEGNSYIIQGLISGLISYIYENPSIEAVHTRCEGRGDNECIYIAAPDKVLINSYIDVQVISLNLTEKKEENTEVYMRVNKIKKINTSSLKDLIHIGLFKNYKENKEIFLYKNKKFFLIDSSIIFLVENYLKNYEEEIFDIAFKVGSEIDVSINFLGDFLSALGWGDVRVSENEIIADHFPWSNFIENIENYKFPFFSGMVCGILSREKNKKIYFKDLKAENTLSEDAFKVKIRIKKA